MGIGQIHPIRFTPGRFRSPTLEMVEISRAAASAAKE
jgi:hypothetical protein